MGDSRFRRRLQSVHVGTNCATEMLNDATFDRLVAAGFAQGGVGGRAGLTVQIEDGKVSTMLRQLGRTLQHAIQDGTILGRIG